MSRSFCISTVRSSYSSPFMQFKATWGVLLSKSFATSYISFYTLPSASGLVQTSTLSALCLLRKVECSETSLGRLVNLKKWNSICDLCIKIEILIYLGWQKNRKIKIHIMALILLRLLRRPWHFSQSAVPVNWQCGSTGEDSCKGALFIPLCLFMEEIGNSFPSFFWVLCYKTTENLYTSFPL